MKKIEKRDAILTGVQQIDRLLRPGSKYANLNPFDVRLLIKGGLREAGSGSVIL